MNQQNDTKTQVPENGHVISDSAIYETFDTRTGKVIASGVYGNRRAIRAGAERRNQAWGAYRYSCRVKPTA